MSGAVGRTFRALPVTNSRPTVSLFLLASAGRLLNFQVVFFATGTSEDVAIDAR
jgi:hypothetical protein